MNLAGSHRLRWMAVLLLVVIVSRLPLLFTCYSSDPDGWRVAYVGRSFWQSGVYSVSRFPGYPVQEILAGLASLVGGAFLSNTTTFLLSLVLIVNWHGFVEKHTPSAGLLTILLAFTPVFWVDSASTMDYVWSLLFIFLSFSTAQQKRPWLAGLWLGVAIGCRPTNGVAILPVFVLLYLHSASKKDLAGFLLASVASTLVSLSPILITYGPTEWVRRTLTETTDAHLPLVLRAQAFLYRATYSLGPLAALALIAIIASRARTIGQLCHERDPIMVASLAGVLGFVLLFALFPLDRSYLLPAVPFLFLIVGRIATRRALVVLACCVVSFAFINPDLIHHGRPIGTFAPNVHAGILIEEWNARNQLQRERDAIARLPMKGKAVVMLGISELYLLENPAVQADSSRPWTTASDYVARSKANPDILFVSALPLHTLRALKAKGYGLYCLDRAREVVRRWNGYDPVEVGVTPFTF